jgi:hypothetical protein
MLKSLPGFMQIEQVGVSDKLPQTEQALVCVFSSMMDFTKSLISSPLLRNKSRAKRMAVLLPIPGKVAICSVAFSRYFDGICTG